MAIGPQWNLKIGKETWKDPSDPINMSFNRRQEYIKDLGGFIEKMVQRRNNLLALQAKIRKEQRARRKPSKSRG
jgi:hypothetical protein